MPLKNTVPPAGGEKAAAPLTVPLTTTTPPVPGIKVPLLTAPIIVNVPPLAALRVPPEPVRLLPAKETLPAPMDACRC